MYRVQMKNVYSRDDGWIKVGSIWRDRVGMTDGQSREYMEGQSRDDGWIKKGVYGGIEQG